MKTAARALIVVLILLQTTSAVLASGGSVQVYGIVSKVVFEPNDKAPERIQIWGALTLADGGSSASVKTLTPRRGYMYFLLPTDPTQREVTLKEWADFKGIAGTGQAVAFGWFGYIGVFSDELISRPAGQPPYVLMGGTPNNFNGSAARNPIRAESAAPTDPDSYPLNMGLTKLSSTGTLSAIVQQLQQALKK